MKPSEEKLLRAVGRRVAELRRARGETQEQFAARYRTSVKYIQAIEGGRENLTLLTLRDLALTLGVPVAELLVPPATLTAAPGRPPKALAPPPLLVADRRRRR